MTDARRAIPSVERLLADPLLATLLQSEPRARVTAVLRALQEEVRAAADVWRDESWYAQEARQRIALANRYSLRAVINATGVVLHTNLGRAPLSPNAIAAIENAARAYTNLEYDLVRGARGSRYDHCATLLRELTGAEAALVVNNNAAALVLALNTIAMGRPVLVSRGELVEIGDSFRIAEIADRSGAQVREVGATNRTHLADYADVLDGAAAILKVHPSNFQTTGFVNEVPVSELAPLCRQHSVPLIHDLGSGLVDPLDDLGLSGEPTAADALRAGANIVTMSGDKLLGGPQAGIVLGSAERIAAMKRNPLCRALRVDKLTIAALEATLLAYARGTARSEIPVLRMLAATPAELAERARQIAARIEGAVTVQGESAVGGGAYPAATLATTLVRLRSDNANHLEEKLRTAEPAVIARIVDDAVCIDPRTVLPEQQDELMARILSV